MGKRLLPIEEHKTEKAIIVGIQNQGHDLNEVNYDLDELAMLLSTLQVECCGRIVQRIQKFSASHLLGAGKISELCNLVKEHDANPGRIRVPPLL